MAAASGVPAWLWHASCKLAGVLTRVPSPGQLRMLPLGPSLLAGMKQRQTLRCLDALIVQALSST